LQINGVLKKKKKKKFFGEGIAKGFEKWRGWIGTLIRFQLGERG
jgi:hypothetical protein